jgi:hypothetical protein
MLIDGHEFTFTGLEPYTRKDGKQTTLRVWRTTCKAEGCNNTWEVRTPAGANPAHQVPDASYPPVGRVFNRTLCKECYVPGDRKPMQAPNGGWTWAKTSNADVVEIRRLAASGVPYATIALCFPLQPGTIREIVKGRRR